jgi:hypothetical protein
MEREQQAKSPRSMWYLQAHGMPNSLYAYLLLRLKVRYATAFLDPNATLMGALFR